MQLLLIRHGQSVNNLVMAQTGSEDHRHPDAELTETGLEQAKRLGQAFADGVYPRPDVLISSLMMRAVQTVAPVAAALDMPVRGCATAFEVRGVHSGDPNVAAVPEPGAPASQLLAICPQLQLPPDADESGWYHGSFETPAQAWLRAQAVMNGLAASYAHTDHTIALVTHGWFSQFLIRAFIEWPPDGVDGGVRTWLELFNTGTALLRHPGPPLGRRSSLVWLNRFEHLPAEMVTQ